MPSRRARLEGTITTSKRTGPLVVIPRRRKHKNYVSRRRNNQILVNLRHCSSDPNLYKSYNEWDKLVKADIFVNDNSEHPNKKKDVVEFSIIKEAPSSSWQFLKTSASPRTITTRRMLVDDEGVIKATTSLSNTYRVPFLQEDEKLSGPKFIISTAQVSTNAVITEKPSNTTSVRRFNFKKIVKPFVDVSCTPSTSNACLPSDSSQQLTEEKKANKNNEQRVIPRPKAEELAQIKKELLESRAKIGVKLSKKVLNIRGKQQSKEEIDDAKAKNTVNAVTAAFSSKIRNNEDEANNLDVVLKQPLTPLGVAKKPPASPSMGAKRFTFKTLETNTQLNDLKMSSNKIKNVAPTSIIPPTLYKESYSQKELRKPQELQAECSISKNIDSNLLKPQQEDDLSQMENSISIASAVVPVLNLSRQKTPTNQQHQQQKLHPSSKKPITNTSSLLASLQLPPSVSAKVDKIIAGSGKKIFTVRIACN